MLAVTARTDKLRWIARAGTYDSIINPLVMCVFLSFLLVGGDLAAIEAGPFHLKVAFATIFTGFLLAATLSRGQLAFNRTLFALSILFFLSAIMSIINSVSFSATAGYSFWLLYTFFIQVPLFYSVGRSISVHEVYRLWFGVFRLTAALLVIQGVAWALFLGLRPGGELRPHLWFYEPSYASIFFTAYSGAALYLATMGQKWAFLDVAISLIVVFTLRSATGAGGLITSIVLCMLISRYRMRLIVVVAGLGAILVPISIMYLIHNKGLMLMVGFLFQHVASVGDLFQAILLRGGNRIIRLIYGWDAFIHHPLFGIGFGADKAYVATAAVPELARPYVFPWSNYEDDPFINPFIEAAGTMGIPGLTVFALIVLQPIRRFIGLRRDLRDEVVLIKGVLVGFIAMFLVIQAEGTLLRPYLWSTFALSLGAFDRWRASQRKAATPFSSGNVAEI